MPWVDEIARYGLVWMTFSIIGYLIRTDDHITLETVDLVVPKRFNRFVQVFSNVVVMVSAIMFTISIVYLILGLSTRQGTLAFGIPMFYIYLVPLFGFGLPVFHSFVRIFLLLFDPEYLDKQPASVTAPDTEEV